jgi:hypothetical protein
MGNRTLSMLAALAGGLTASVLSFVLMPRAAQATRTNCIGPEVQVVHLASAAGHDLPVAVELTATAESRAVFFVERPYLRRSEAAVRIVDAGALPSDLDVDALNGAVTAWVRARTTGSWGMDRLAIPQFPPGQRPTEARTSEHRWEWAGVLVEGELLLLIGLAGGVLVHTLLGLRGPPVRTGRPAEA